MHTVKYRLFEPRLAPRRTKLEVPGWAGKPEPRRDGSHEYGWHCMPFVEGAQYGIELFYPFDNELHVTKRDGHVVLDGDFGPDPKPASIGRPSALSAKTIYTYQLLLDLKVAEDMAVRTEPHPRFYTSANDDVPLAVPALLRTNWWPMISFVVFKAPPEGRTHIFRPGEPFMQIVFLPAEPQFELVADGRGGSRRAGNARPANPCEPRHAGQGLAVVLVNQHGIRRHVPPDPARCQGQSKTKRRLKDVALVPSTATAVAFPT